MIMTANSKTEARRNRLAGINHRLFGTLGNQPVPGTVFNPHHYLADPGRFRDCLAWWEYKARRNGVGAGLPKALRESAIAQAGQDTLQVFLDRDYKAAGITADECSRAVMSAAAYMQRAGYRLSSIGDGPRLRRMKDRKWHPYNRAQNARTPNPAAIVAITLYASEDREALHGDGDDIPGETVNVPGGPGGRGVTDGKMVATMDIVREWVERGEPMAEIVTGWKMERKRGRARRYAPCTVTAGKPAKPRRYARQSIPAATVERTAGERSMVPSMVPDVETYRAQLAEYYSGR
jgi:hypothetical protein